MATERQKAAIKGVLIDKKSVQRAMLDAGYSPNVAKNAKELTTSQAWVETMDKLGLSDEDLATKHSELLRSDKEEIAVRALDIGYKVRGKYDHNRAKTQFNAPVLIQISPPNDPSTALQSDIEEE